MFSNLGLNAGYGLTLPTRVEALGFSVTHANSTLHFAPGDSPIARMMGESTQVLREEYMATGEADEKDIEDYIEQAYASDHWSVYYATVSVIAS